MASWFNLELKQILAKDTRGHFVTWLNLHPLPDVHRNRDLPSTGYGCDIAVGAC
jgi:hypothetical protein